MDRLATRQEGVKGRQRNIIHYVDVLVEELCVLPELTVWPSLQSDWLPSAAELFRSPLPTPGTLFHSTSSQLLRCSHLNVI